jgi:hypothetical protein
MPVIYNSTFIGRGITGNHGLISFRNGSGGIYKNSVFINQAWGVEIEYNETDRDSYTKFKNGKLQFENNLFYYLGISDYTNVMNLVNETISISKEKQDEINNHFVNSGNLVSDPGIDIESNYVMVLPTGNVEGTTSEPYDPWFDNVGYKGAFKNVNWTTGWSYLSKVGYLR